MSYDIKYTIQCAKQGLPSAQPYFSHTPECHFSVSMVYGVRAIRELIEFDKLAHLYQHDPVAICTTLGGKVTNLWIRE